MINPCSALAKEQPTCVARTCKLSDVDGVAATPSHEDAIAATMISALSPHQHVRRPDVHDKPMTQSPMNHIEELVVRRTLAVLLDIHEHAVVAREAL